MNTEARCYLCDWAYKFLIEHPERKNRTYFYKCKIDEREHAPCHSCEYFQEKLNKKEINDGRTHSLEENH